MLDFQQIIHQNNFINSQQLFEHFKEKAWNRWVDEYIQESHEIYGEITCQGFFGGFQFVIDMTNDWVEPEFPRCNLPDTRVVVGFGLSTTPADKANRTTMRSYWRHTPLMYERFGCRYNKGHLIAHSMGGPIDVNLFPQIEHINLGRSEKGKKFRSMEKYIAAHPGTFVFARLVYHDFSDCPHELEYGYCDETMLPVVETFPNRS